MNNDFPEVKETIEKIEVPYDKLDQTIDTAIKKGKDKRVIPKKRFPRVVAVASLAVCVVISSAFVSPAAAKMLSSIPLLNSVFEFAGDRGLQIASQRGLSKKIDQTVVDQNISLTIQDVFYDGTRLSISYVQETVGMLGELTLKVDGKEINFGDGRTGEKLPNDQYAGVLNIHTSEELPESFKLSIGVKEIGDVKGEWNFDVPVETSVEEIKTISPMKTMVFGDTTITVKSVHIGPAGVKLLVDVTRPREEMFGTEGSLFEMNVLTDQGESLTHMSGSGSGDEEDGKSVMHMEYRYAPLEESTEFLTVSPYFIHITSEDRLRIEQPLQRSELPITLDQGEMGKIIVTDVQYEADKTLLHFKVESDFPYDGHLNLNGLWIEDAAGNDLTSNAKGYPERIAPNMYVQEFQPTSDSTPLTVVTLEMLRLEVVEELQVKIPMPKELK